MRSKRGEHQGSAESGAFLATRGPEDGSESSLNLPAAASVECAAESESLGLAHTSREAIAAVSGEQKAGCIASDCDVARLSKPPTEGGRAR